MATVLPRLVALLHERGSILPGFTFGEKSDDFARTFLDSGTFGFIAGLPSAYTQPLYSSPGHASRSSEVCAGIAPILARDYPVTPAGDLVEPAPRPP